MWNYSMFMTVDIIIETEGLIHFCVEYKTTSSCLTTEPQFKDYQRGIFVPKSTVEKMAHNDVLVSMAAIPFVKRRALVDAMSVSLIWWIWLHMPLPPE